ncbi:MAG: hypothetical protein Q4B08_08130 [Propionibacteriaceae bacterium]|nr:hypothetical protein [Propionibacteriaceae bacterium]
MADEYGVCSILDELKAAAGDAAPHNVQAIAGLYEQLRETSRAAGVDDAELGRRLGVTAIDARSILLGEVDITLTDLELILAAIDARIRIDVTPARVSTEIRTGSPAWVKNPPTKVSPSWKQAPDPKPILA